MDSSPAIEDHGLIGDLQAYGSVATDGTIDWFCAPRFPSTSIFAALLDREKGGHFQIAPEGTTYVKKQLYLRRDDRPQTWIYHLAPNGLARPREALRGTSGM